MVLCHYCEQVVGLGGGRCSRCRAVVCMWCMTARIGPSKPRPLAEAEEKVFQSAGGAQAYMCCRCRRAAGDAALAAFHIGFPANAYQRLAYIMIHPDQVKYAQEDELMDEVGGIPAAFPRFMDLLAEADTHLDYVDWFYDRRAGVEGWEIETGHILSEDGFVRSFSIKRSWGRDSITWSSPRPARWQDLRKFYKKIPHHLLMQAAEGK